MLRSAFGAHQGFDPIGNVLRRLAKLPEADRFVFASRFTGDSCVAIFERAFGRLRASGIAELVRHMEFLEALDDDDIVLTAPPDRAK